MIKKIFHVYNFIKINKLNIIIMIKNKKYYYNMIIFFGYHNLFMYKNKIITLFKFFLLIMNMFQKIIKIY
jgi:hypothetical protein